MSAEMRPVVLVISFSETSRDPRVRRQIQWLSSRYQVWTAGFGSANQDCMRHTSIRPARGRTRSEKIEAAFQLLTGQTDRYYWNTGTVLHAWTRLRCAQPDLVVANDLETLPLALRVGNGAPVLFDAHEYTPKQFTNRLSFRLFFQRYYGDLGRRYMPRAARVTTVSAGIAKAYEVLAGITPVLVTNAPDFVDQAPGPTAPDRIRLVHHGNATPARKLESMINAMERLDDRFRLDLYLVPTSLRYYEWLRRRAAGDHRIRILEPVPLESLPRVLNRYDVGITFFPPTTFNLLHALPNKFFEYIQARLGVVTGPSPAMAAIVDRCRCGVVTRDFSGAGLAEALRALDVASIQGYKQASDGVAHELSAEANRRKFLGLVETLLDS